MNREATCAIAQLTPTQLLLKTLAQTPRPSVLYHYTSPDGLFGIVKSARIWATDIRYLNDALEFNYGLDLIRSSVEVRQKRTSDVNELALYSEFANDLSVAVTFRVFAASLSAKCDLLSQWRAYCPPTGGFAIGFESALLTTTPNCWLIPCVYDPKAQLKLVNDFVDSCLDVYTKLRVSSPELDTYQFFGGSLLLAAALKDSGFSEETEWRLVGIGFDDEHAPEFRLGRSGIVPYIELPVGSSEAPRQIGDVIVGPSPHSTLSKDATTALLRRYGVQHDGVKLSRVPFRPW